MKVAFLIDRFEAGKGGLERDLVRLAEQFRKSGDEPVLISMDRKVSGFPGRVVATPGLGMPRGIREWCYARHAQKAVEATGCEKSIAFRHAIRADVYRPLGGSFYSAWTARQKSKGGLRAWFSQRFRKVNLKLWLLDRLERRLVESVDRIEVPSELVAEEFRRAYPQQAQKIELVSPETDLDSFTPTGVKIDFRKLHSLPSNSRIALFVAQDFELKGLETAIRCVAALNEPKPQWHLFVLGRGRSLERWKAIARDCDSAPRIHFLGEAQQLASYYRGADLFLYPSFYDSFGHVVLEAQACGIPVVTSAAVGAVSRLNLLKSRVVKEAGDVGGFVHAIEELSATFSS